jgi:VacB/RNase II family 3'-5' exoribonuclease
MNRAINPNRDQLRGIARRAMLERGLLPDFSAAVLVETDAIGKPAQADSSFRDLRSLLWVSIDNDDSRDLDHLSVAVPMAGGAVKILLAVADVDAIVKRGSAIDGHARANTTSVYTAAEIFSMLPEKLSTDLTSLGEGQERLAVVIEMVVSSGDGVVNGSGIYRAVVVNHAKLAYNGVSAWLEGASPALAQMSSVPGLGEQLRIQDRVAQSMKRLRHQHGALSLETIEARPVFDGDVLADLRSEKKNRAEELIEEFMIAGNGVTAKYLERRGFPSLRRVLRVPERWDRIVELAAAFGARLPSQPDIRALEDFLVKRRQTDPARFPDLSLAVIKLLGRGEYVLELPGHGAEGHFGLAVKDYTHSTAPNRRYPDLVTQRLLRAAIEGQAVPYSGEELGELARHSTEKEDAAAKVERQVQKSAAALLLARRIGEQFDAIVTGASEKGTWVRILQPATEGKVVRGYQGLDVGDHVRVELVDTNVERGFVDFARVASS